MRSRTPSVNGSVCPSPYGSMHKKVKFPYSVPLSLSLSLSLLIITTRQKNNDGRFPSTNNMINLTNYNFSLQFLLA